MNQELTLVPGLILWTIIKHFQNLHICLVIINFVVCLSSIANNARLSAVSLLSAV